MVVALSAWVSQSHEHRAELCWPVMDVQCYPINVGSYKLPRFGDYLLLQHKLYYPYWYTDQTYLRQSGCLLRLFSLLKVPGSDVSSYWSLGLGVIIHFSDTSTDLLAWLPLDTQNSALDFWSLASLMIPWTICRAWAKWQAQEAQGIVSRMPSPTRCPYPDPQDLWIWHDIPYTTKRT